MLPVMLVVDGVPSFDLPMTTWLAVAYYALVATAGAYLLYYRVLAAAGSGNLLWDLTETEDWLELDPISGTTASVPQTVTGRIAREGLEAR